MEQYKQRISRKKNSVEAMLKTAVQSQLDGVISGLQQLQSALTDLGEIRGRYQLIIIFNYCQNILKYVFYLNKVKRDKRMYHSPSNTH